MNTENKIFTGGQPDTKEIILGCSVIVPGLLALRCFLRSRLVLGALFLFAAVLILVLKSRLRSGRAAQNVCSSLFAVLLNAFAAVLIPVVVYVFLGVFHPFWIFSGAVFLLAGFVLFARDYSELNSVAGCREPVILCQLVMVPLVLLLYYANAAVSVYFIWLYPLYTILVSVFFRTVLSLLPGGVLAPVLAVISFTGLLAGLLSEFVL